MFDNLPVNNITAQTSVNNNLVTDIGSKSTGINASFQSCQVDSDAAVKVKKAKKAAGSKRQSSRKGKSATIPVLSSSNQTDFDYVQTVPDPALYNGNPLRRTYGPIDNTEQTKHNTNSGLTLTNYHLTPGFAYPQAPIQASSVNQRLEPQTHHSTQPPTRYQNGHSRRLVQQAPWTIVNSSSCTTTDFSELLTSCLTAA